MSDPEINNFFSSPSQHGRPGQTPSPNCNAAPGNLAWNRAERLDTDKCESDRFFVAQVDENQHEQRLDKFLSLFFSQPGFDRLGMSRSRLQKIIKNGFVTLDENEIIDCSFKVKSGDIFQLEIPPADEAVPEPENIPLDIVYEDADLLVVNKPAGMTVHPAPGAYHQTLVNAILFHCRDNLSGIGGVKRPGIVHRIDKDTSGLLVVAKNDFTHQHLCEQFFDHSIERTYFALAYSLPAPLNGTISGNIGRSKFDRKKMAILEHGGKHAVTHYRTVEAFGTYAALLQCNLETGRTHQIRVHLSSIGCNLIGDQVYVKNHKTSIKIPAQIKKQIFEFPRQALHAASLGFIHPRTGQKMSFQSELPPDIKALITTLHNQ